MSEDTNGVTNDPVPESTGQTPGPSASTKKRKKRVFQQIKRSSGQASTPSIANNNNDDDFWVMKEPAVENTPVKKQKLDTDTDVKDPVPTPAAEAKPTVDQQEDLVKESTNSNELDLDSDTELGIELDSQSQKNSKEASTALDTNTTNDANENENASANANADHNDEIEEIFIDDYDDESKDASNGNQKTADDVEVIEDVEKERVPTDLDRLIDEYLEMGLNREMAERMAKQDIKNANRKARSSSAFTVVVELHGHNSALRHFDRKFEMQSDEPFSKLRDRYLDILKSSGYDEESNLYRFAQLCEIVSGTIKLSTASTPEVFKDSLTRSVLGDQPSLKLTLMTQSELEQFRLQRQMELAKQEQQEQEKQQQEQQQQEDPDDEEVAVVETEAQNEEPATSSFRVVLRGADQVEYEVSVRPETQIATIAEFYRSKAQLAPDVNIQLEFDDEPLDYSLFVRDTELEEDFTIDVHI